MLTNSPKPARKSVKTSAVKKPRYQVWRETLERLRVLPLSTICLALAVEISLRDDFEEIGEEERARARDCFQNALRERNVECAINGRSARRMMMDDPVCEFAERLIPYGADDDEVEATVFKYFGLDQSEPAHRGFLLAILADIYFNTPVSGRPTGSKQWTDGKLCFLGATAYLLKLRFPKATNKTLAHMIETEVLPRDHRDNFSKRVGEALRYFKELLESDPLNATRWLDVAHMEGGKVLEEKLRAAVMAN